jgi:hypothetical protein
MKKYLLILAFFISSLPAINLLAQSELMEEEKKTELSFTVSPMPFDDQVVVNIQHKNVTVTSVRVFDAIMSKEIAYVEVSSPSKNGTTTVTLNLPAGLKPGVYFCVLYSNKDIIDTKRLLKAAF